MRTRIGAAAPVLALLLGGTLAGCGSVPPGVASVVAGHQITRQQVAELADAQCAGIQQAARQGNGQTVSRKQLTERALGLLIDIQLNLAYGKKEGLTPRPAQVTQDLSQIKPLIASLPSKYHADLTDIFTDWAKGRDLMTQVGERQTGQRADASNAEALLNAGYQQRQSWLKSVKIRTDPRYSPSKAGWPGEGSSSVSTPVSDYARSSAKATPSATFLAGLPAGQRCG